MHYLCKIFKNLRKIFQKSDLILLDILTARDSAIVNINVINEMPALGGQGEQYLKDLDLTNNSTREIVRRAIQAH